MTSLFRIRKVELPIERLDAIKGDGVPTTKIRAKPSQDAVENAKKN